MTEKLTQEMKYKLALWQEACVLIRQTQRLFDRKFEINSAPTRPTIYAIHRKFMATGSVADTR